jgi:hypothetical protein
MGVYAGQCVFLIRYNDDFESVITTGLLQRSPILNAIASALEVANSSAPITVRVEDNSHPFARDREGI